MTPAESAERFWGPAERAEGCFFLRSLCLVLSHFSELQLRLRYLSRYLESLDCLPHQVFSVVAIHFY